MAIQYTKKFLEQLENFIRSLSFKLRYEKGNFEGGFCIIQNEKVIIVNRFISVEGKIDTLLEVLNVLKRDAGENFETMDISQKEFYSQLPSGT